MDIKTTSLQGVLIVRVPRHADVRGYFCEPYNRRTFFQNGIDVDFVQDNFSFSAHAGTVRGLHFQIPPHPQAKLVRVLRGAILDVVVDLRANSPTCMKHIIVELTAGDGKQVFIPAGFAHGFRTIEPDTEVLYKVSDYYEPACDKGIRWDDPALAIPWGVPAGKAVVSERDARHPLAHELPAFFFFDPSRDTRSSTADTPPPSGGSRR